MSSSCNGDKYKNKPSKKTLSLPYDYADTNSWESIRLEDGFKGFERAPEVVLPRYDITPYIKGKSGKSSPKPSKEDSADILSHFTRKCFVKLNRDDLQPILDVLSTSKSSPDPEESDSGTDTEGTMSLKCKICEKSYSSEKKLLNHLSKKHIIYKDNKPKKKVSFSDHIIVHEVREYHRCRKCTKIFEDYKSLKRHMKQQHKKRKCYICNYCDKNFMDRMFFKVHIKLHCDVCGVLFPNRAKYYEHKRSSCRVFKLHKCKTCSESYFNVMHLKDHSYEHTNVSYVCDICKDQFVTKCGIAHHISFLHSPKRPESMYMMRNLGSERLYLCNFCDESSVDKDIIEAHVQMLPDLTNKAMTGYKDYYFCDQCFMKFDMETDMLQHKWTHFLRTSDNSQIQPKSILTNKTELIATFNCKQVPDTMKPKVVLERINIDGKVVNDKLDYVDVKSFDDRNGEIKKAIVDPKSKKTIISRYQCQTCGKYFSSNYCLMRHIDTQHSDYENLRCNVCEENFAWPSLLKSHKCVRLRPEQTHFDDNRPEINFDNLHGIGHNGFDDLNISDSDYINSLDFELPEPIVELTEHGSFRQDLNYNSGVNVSSLEKISLGNGYKLITQEVPIEF